MIIVVMGVSGSGKSTVGSGIARALGWAFLDGDTLHSPSNIEKLSRGTPLTDADRAPWLRAIHQRIRAAFDGGEDLVVACSALKAAYREALSGGIPITWVYLKGSRGLIEERARHRKGHFVASDLVASQFETLEEPDEALAVDVTLSPEAIVRRVLARLGRRDADGSTSMQLGMIGLGRMGGNMVRRLLKGDHDCVVFDTDQGNVEALAREGATGSASLDEFVTHLGTPRTVWLMLPAAAVDGMLERLAPRLQAGDIIVEGGNSHYVDDIRRSAHLRERGVHYVDVGVSGGVWGLERGYCLMIGGEQSAVTHLEPLFKTLAPGREAAVPTPGRKGSSTADQGYLHCGPAGAGHFVKMVHNGIEYGLMAAYAEGFNLLEHADVGFEGRHADAETAPLPRPEHFRYEFPLADIAEVWRRGSVIGSWLLDLTATALAKDPGLEQFAGRVSDSGEGRWAAQAGIESSTPMPVLTAALFQRFASRGEDDFARKLMSAMRHQFGGHHERGTGQ